MKYDQRLWIGIPRGPMMVMMARKTTAHAMSRTLTSMQDSHAPAPGTSPFWKLTNNAPRVAAGNLSRQRAVQTTLLNME